MSCPDWDWTAAIDCIGNHKGPGARPPVRPCRPFGPFRPFPPTHQPTPQAREPDTRPVPSVPLVLSVPSRQPPEPACAPERGGVFAKGGREPILRRLPQWAVPTLPATRPGPASRRSRDTSDRTD
jgi:hypothetical protein